MLSFSNSTMISKKAVPLTITEITVREQMPQKRRKSPYVSQLEANMLASAAAVFECSMLFIATVTALFSIVNPKIQAGLYSVLVLLPISLLMISHTEAASDDLDD